MKRSAEYTTGRWTTFTVAGLVLLLSPIHASAHTFIAPSAVQASADGSFSYTAVFTADLTAGVDIAGAGFDGLVNVDPIGFHGDSFCDWDVDPGEEFPVDVSASLVDIAQRGLVKAWLAPCDGPTLFAQTAIVPPKRQCIKTSCKQKKKLCTKAFKNQFRTKTGCRDLSGGVRKLCKRNRKNLFRKDRNRCKVAFKNCRKCCKEGGPDCGFALFGDGICDSGPVAARRFEEKITLDGVDITTGVYSWWNLMPPVEQPSPLLTLLVLTFQSYAREPVLIDIVQHRMFFSGGKCDLPFSAEREPSLSWNGVVQPGETFTLQFMNRDGPGLAPGDKLFVVSRIRNGKEEREVRTPREEVQVVW